MFTKAGPVSVIIKDVAFATAKFAKGEHDFDICIQVANRENECESDWWRGEVSANYGKGNFATMTQAEITMKTLHGIGFDGSDLSTLKSQIVGKTTTAMIKETQGKNDDGKVFYNIQYLGSGGGGNAPKEEDILDVSNVQNRISAMFGGGSAPAPVKETPKPAPAAASNPFGSKQNPFARKT